MLGPIGVIHLDQFLNLPDMIGNPGRNRRGRFHRQMLPAEIVMHEVQRNRSGMIGEFLAESVRQPGEPPHAHTHRKVLALNMRRANLIHIGTSENRHFISPNHGILTVLAFPIDFDQLGKMAAVRIKCLGERKPVSTQTITADLNFPIEAFAKIEAKRHSTVNGAITNEP